jgi:hypothetical protein
VQETTIRTPYAPQPSPAQSELIDALGGPSAVAGIIQVRIGYQLTPQAISTWRRRGIPFRYRPHLSREAGERGIELPPNFLLGEVVDQLLSLESA